MTSAKQLFPRASFVGFDHLLAELDQVARQANDHYPPHNILKVSPEEYVIELAVAGFKRSDVDIEVDDRTLTVRGEQNQSGSEYIHRGISSKRFVRTFRLSEYVQVQGANLTDGILSIELKVVLPEEKRPRKVNINQHNEVITHDTNQNSSQFLKENSTQHA